MVTFEMPAGIAADALSVSGAAAVGEFLFLAPDEGASLVRLRRVAEDRFAEAVTYPVAGFVDPPGSAGDELDLEGLDQADGILWCIGSHSAVRSRVRGDTPSADIPARLAEVKHPKARHLLARIPLLDGVPVKEVPGARAARLTTRPGEALLDLLRQDEHLGPFVDLPSKDNGLDIEGLVTLPPRVLIGLRGPVLRGWAVILEIVPGPDPDDPDRLVLSPVDGDPGRRIGKHFIDLGGLGIRDLARDGDDLLVLAGPTMLLDGPSRILRLPGGAVAPLPVAVRSNQLVQVGDDLEVGDGNDHPEAMTIITSAGRRQVLLAYDSPNAARINGNELTADVLDLS